jgi:hypothetical protein
MIPPPESTLSASANPSAQPANPAIAGSVLPIQKAEELLTTLPGIIAARILASENGSVEAIHLLTTTEVTPKQTVRNVESALIAHLGMKVDHRKISVATSQDPRKPAEVLPEPESTPSTGVPDPVSMKGRPRMQFEDVEIRRSRAKGVLCRVTLSRDGESFIGEAEGVENERSWVELSARATVSAILTAEAAEKMLALDGCKVIEAFGREFVFVGVTARQGRDTALLTGSCEIKESAETAGSLAVLDATNRWLTFSK